MRAFSRLCPVPLACTMLPYAFRSILLPSITLAERCRGDILMDLATVDKLLTTTRTVRKRLDFTRSVDPAIIQTCLEIAIQAPTGGNIAWYHFVVVTDGTKRTDLAALYKRAYWEVYSP